MIPGQRHRNRQSEREQQKGNARHGVGPIERFAGQPDGVLDTVGHGDIAHRPLRDAVILQPTPQSGWGFGARASTISISRIGETTKGICVCLLA